jgi:hypothetical protein
MKVLACYHSCECIECSSGCAEMCTALVAAA